MEESEITGIVIIAAVSDGGKYDRAAVLRSLKYPPMTRGLKKSSTQGVRNGLYQSAQWNRKINGNAMIGIL